MVVLALIRRFWPVVLGLILLVCFLGWKANLKDTSEKRGATVERTRSLEGVVTDVQTAKKAAAEVTDTGNVVKYNQCVRSSRTAANCARYLPNRQADYREPGPRPVNP